MLILKIWVKQKLVNIQGVIKYIFCFQGGCFYINGKLKISASILKNQRYSSDDLYKPRPVVSGSSRRQRGLLNNTG